MKYHIFLRWSIYLLYTSITCEGLFYPRQRDARYRGGSLISSPNRHNSTEQLYSTWSEWTPCSATCDLGISSKTRTCLKSAHNSRGVSVPLCQGELIEHKICNIRVCPTNSLGSREIQCSQHNNQVIAGKLVKSWLPSNGGPNPCELRCEASTGQLVYGFGKAADGTPCPLGVCLDGRCLSIGCDERLGSGVTLDMCGICGGRNSSCVHYKDVFQGQPTVGGDSRSAYHEVVVIPSSARNLIIRQPLGKNILALQDRSKGIIFNSEQNSNKYGGHFEIAGSKVEFLKVENFAEELLAKGPVSQELYVLVLLRSHNPGIYYEYWLPKQSHNPGGKHFSLQPHIAQVIPTPTPRTSKSYTVPFYRPRVPSTNQSPRHPSKPLFAYGYGEKPYKGQESPIFRHSPTTSLPKKKGYIAPDETQSESPVYYNSDSRHRSPPFKRGIGPLQKPNPSLDYYKTFRNTSMINPPDAGNSPKVPDYEVPVLTQGDSSSPDGSEKHRNTFHKSDESEKKPLSLSKNPKPIASDIYINKRVDNSLKNYIPNGRLKYSFEEKNKDGVYVNFSGRHTPAALTINVLPLPESETSKQRQDSHKKDRSQKPRLTRGGICEPCQRIRDQLKHFCLSDFVIRALVVGFETVQGETRYELEVKQSFKNTFSLQSKEYVWTPDTCRCPKLRSRKEYVIMGRSDNSYSKRESRLLVDKTCFVRTFNQKYARRLQKLKKEQGKKCRKIS